MVIVDRIKYVGGPSGVSRWRKLRRCRGNFPRREYARPVRCIVYYVAKTRHSRGTFL